MKKYPDCHGKLVSMKNYERKEIILRKLSEIEKLFNDIQELDPETLKKKDREDIFYAGEEVWQDINCFFTDIEGDMMDF